MANGLEKKFQAEVSRSFKALGFAQRLEQDTIICLKCHSPIHPKNKGYPDVHGELYAFPYNIPIKVEAKANKDRILTDAVSVYQRHFLNKYVKNNGVAYVWYQLGDDNVNNKSSGYARCVWLIPYQFYLASLVIVRKQYRLKYIPLQLEKRMRLKDTSMTVRNLFSDCVMEWIPGKRLWRPNKYHEIWRLKGLRVTYDSFGHNINDVGETD